METIKGICYEVLWACDLKNTLEKQIKKKGENIIRTYNLYEIVK